jgi:CheY-like chemotaxis protein
LTVSPRVLIVDQSAESREILRTLLDRLGATTIEARRADQAVQLAREHQPHLIVLDAESDGSAAGAATDDLRAVASRNDTPIVILGTLRHVREPLPAGQIVAKPYHYGPLIRKIDGLLAAA